jgi:hypothetical protein
MDQPKPKTEAETLAAGTTFALLEEFPPGIYEVIEPGRLREKTQAGARVVRTIDVIGSGFGSRQEFIPTPPGGYLNTCPVSLTSAHPMHETRFVIREDLDSVLTKLQAEAMAAAKRAKEAIDAQKIAESELATETDRADAAERRAKGSAEAYDHERDRANRGEAELVKLRAAYKTLRTAIGELEAKKLLGE